MAAPSARVAPGGEADALTARQRRILDVIHRTIRDRGYPPTVREIGEAVGLTSSSSVHAQLATLERRGLLHRDPTKPRTITTAEPKPRAAVVPVIGRIAAGAPILAADIAEDHVTVPREYVSDGREHFALHVRGDSMTGAGIFEGDLVIVRSQDDANDGDLVAAILPGPAEDEATVKRLKRSRGRVMLIPENPAYDPIEMPEGGRIAGRVVAVLRKL
jgi:repressor LexA